MGLIRLSKNQLFVALNELTIPIEFIAVNDLFGETGTTEDLYKKHHLDKQTIKNAIRKVLKRKSG